MERRVGGYIPNELKSCLVSVYSYEGRALRGTVENPRLGTPAAFCGTMELLLRIDALMDEIGFPERGTRPRMFPAALPPRPGVCADVPRGEPLARFELRVLFRQNASWQGTVLWLGHGGEIQFRSVLELLTLLDGALAVS